MSRLERLWLRWRWGLRYKDVEGIGLVLTTNRMLSPREVDRLREYVRAAPPSEKSPVGP